jgi:hypothetical protein
MAERFARRHGFALGARVVVLGTLAVSTAIALVEDPKEARSYRAEEDEHALEPKPRASFVIGEHTGVDQKSHLEWAKKSAPDRLAWEIAKEYCATLAIEGGGFRLPSRDELLTLLGKGEDPFDSDIDWYWSSTPGVREKTAWAVGAGAWLNGNPTTTKSRVRCVRNAR